MGRWAASLLFVTLTLGARVYENETTGERLSLLATTHNAGGKSSYSNEAWNTLFGRMLNRQGTFDLFLFGLQEFKSSTSFVKAAESRVHKDGAKCELVKHDTRTGCPWVFGELSMVVCTSPASEWSMKVVKNIDVHHERRIFECSKGSVGSVIEAKKGSKSMKICAITTHMSYSATASDRMDDWEAVMTEVDKLDCSATVFLGDFNTRLHCAVPEVHAQEEDGPLLDSSHAKNSNTFAYVISKACGGSLGCPYDKGFAKPYDEMTSFLYSDTVSCFEKTDGKYVLSEFPNKILKYGLYEHKSMPRFGPTYKLQSNTELDVLTAEEMGLEMGTRIADLVLAGNKNKKPKKEDDTVWSYCVRENTDCLLNKKKKASNNPAWTDRVLLRLSDEIVEDQQDGWYRRLLVPETDHAAVQSALTLKFPN